MGPDNPLVWLLAGIGFLSSLISATFGIGGGPLILVVLGLTLPVSAMVPLHSALALGLLLARLWHFRRHIDWYIVRVFVPGALIGVLLGARVYVAMPPQYIAAAVSLLIMGTVWFPAVRWRPFLPHPFFFVGVIHAFLSTLFSFGGLLQPLMIRTRLDRMQIIGTLSMALGVMTVIKTVSYAAYGFDYRPYAWIIAGAVLASFPGARAGKALARRFDEDRFRLAFRLVMTFLALRLMYKALTIA